MTNLLDEKLLGRVNSSGNLSDDDQDNDRSCMAILAAIVSTLGAIGFGYTLGFTSPALSAMEGEVFIINSCTDNNSVSSQADWFSSLANIGALFGALLGGWLTNTLGRKGTVMAASIPYVGGWAWLAMAPTKTFWMFIAARVLCGLGVGISSMSVPMYIAETAPVRLRGALGTLNQFGVVVGITFVYGLGAVLKKEKNVDRWGHQGNGTATDPLRYCDGSASTIGDGWVSLAWVGCGLAIAQFVLMVFMPKTPRWLVTLNKDDEAIQSLRWLRGPDYDHRGELQELYGSSDNDETDAGWLDLFRPGLRLQLFIACALMFFQQWSGINGVMFYCSEIFTMAGVGEPMIIALLLQGVQLFFTGVAVLLMDRAGRKVLLLCSEAGLTFFLGTLGLFFFLNPHAPNGDITASWLAVTSLMGFMVFFSIGVGAIPWILMSEVFPSRARSKACGLATALNWMLAFAVTKFFPELLNLSKPFTFWGCGLVCLVGCIFIQTTVVETKGKSLEEIEEHFRPKARGYEHAGYA